MLEVMRRRAACTGIPWGVPLDKSDNRGIKHIAQIRSRVLADLGSGTMPPYIIGRHRDSQK